MKVQVYIANHCQPCQEVKELLEKGHFLINGAEGQAELVDIESEEGFKRIAELGLEGVPAVYQGGKKCKIQVDSETDTLLLECGESGEDKGHKLFVVRERPRKYPQTEQQKRFRQVLEECNITKGITRDQLIDRMIHCIPEVWRKINASSESSPPVEPQP